LDRTIPDLPFSSYGGAAVTVGGRIYVVNINAAVFDPATRRWIQLESPPTPRYWMNAEVDAADRIVTLGGTVPGGGGTFSGIEIYDPVQATWSGGKRMPIPVFQLATAAACGRIFVLGGSYTASCKSTARGMRGCFRPRRP
jgi:hypothetical protein